MSKINFNASGEQMTDEVHSDVGAGEFSLDHSVFLQSGFLCSRLSGGTQPLTYGVDYILTSINERLRTEAGIVTYQKVKVLNATYQSGALYFTYKAVADFIEAEDWSNADTVDSLHANDNAVTDNDATLATKNKIKTYVDTYADTKIAKTTNVTAIDDTGIADNEIAIFDLTLKKIKTSDKVIGNATGNVPLSNGTVNTNLNSQMLDGATKSTDGTLADNSDSKIPTEKAVKTYANGTTGTGYAKLPGGLIIQWGYAVAVSAGIATVTLPTAFTGTSYSTVMTLHEHSDADISPYDIKIWEQTTTSFQFRTSLANKGYRWIAIGY